MPGWEVNQSIDFQDLIQRKIYWIKVRENLLEVPYSEDAVIPEVHWNLTEKGNLYLVHGDE